MGADLEFNIGEDGKLNLLFIDKGKKKVNVGNQLSDFNIQRKLYSARICHKSIIC